MLFINRYKKKLINKNILLQEQLGRTIRKYNFGNTLQKHNHFTRDGHYSNIEELPDYNTKWKNSFFELHRDIADLHSKGSLSSQELIALKNSFNRTYSSKISEYTFISHVVHCVAVIPSEEGPKLYLEDPFGKIITSPLRNTSLQTAESWINRILIADIGIHYNNQSTFPVNRIQTLKYSLYD